MVSMIMIQEGATALYFASQEGHVTVVKLLLKKGADVNICNKVVTPFYIIAERLSARQMYVYLCMYVSRNYAMQECNYFARKRTITCSSVTLSYAWPAMGLSLGLCAYAYYHAGVTANGRNDGKGKARATFLGRHRSLPWPHPLIREEGLVCLVSTTCAE